MKYAQRTLAECTQFLCAGRAGFPEILQIFRAIFAQNLRHLDAGLARYLAFERSPTREKELQRSSAVRATTLAEFTQLLCARRAEKFRGLCNSFARVGRKICVIPTLDAFFFGSECNADSINSQRRCAVCATNAGRVHAIFVRGSCRIFRNFARFSPDSMLRKLCVFSTLNSRVIVP